ncbi:Protein of unknown function DUF2252 [[Leptolyngbya] sp. PCC 7376]|uniref:DUF2252 domain-containing protein n=1 Tax=[Leptolyngbya] sp. PCC 7376 TaxID=111781 RepID=UPI00029F09BD|nr:DUF2252 family protein [[Leptolyngbya] sp. PCC 7376]AFY38129.1 Protein of unknown function DUF2252 [[Leptolyngbya] sp. PCC 7376]
MPHFDFEPTARDKDVLAELKKWNEHLKEKDRTYKYRKMICGAFPFFRGTNHLFWHDFANHPDLAQFSNDETQVWVQGDLHAENYGSFHNDEGHIVYDLNDFDESIITDYQYDLWRMASSLILVADQPQFDFSKKEQKSFIKSFCEGYLEAITLYAKDPNAIHIEFTAKNTYGKLDEFLEEVEKTKNRKGMLKKWTNVHEERYRDLQSDKLQAICKETYQAIVEQMPKYGNTLTGELAYDPKYFHVQDIAKRLLAGTGSLGTNRYYILIQGEDKEHKHDCILDMKAQGKPTPYHYLGEEFQKAYNAEFENDAERHAIAYKALIRNTDDHLGWLELDGQSYSIRERSPYKEAFPLETLKKTKRFQKMAEQWGRILATCHSRGAATMLSQTAISFAKNVDKLAGEKADEFIAQIQKVATSYAEQVNLDYKAFQTDNPKLKCLE